MNDFFETTSYEGPVQDWLELPELGTSEDEPDWDEKFRTAGGKGSGNFHHKGRPGKVGGSASFFGDEGEISNKDIKDFNTRLAEAEKNPHPGDTNPNAAPSYKMIPISQYEGQRKRLEKEGWTFFGNTDAEGEFHEDNPRKHTHVRMYKLDSDEEPFPEENWTAAEKKAIADYTYEDMPPTGALGAALEKAVRETGKTRKDLVSYRGLRANAATMKSLKEGSVLSFGRPSSFTASDSFAWEFASSAKSGHRRKVEGTPVLIKALIPAGTKALFADSSRGAASIAFNEHILSGKTKFAVRSVKKYRSGYRVIVEVAK